MYCAYRSHATNLERREAKQYLNALYTLHYRPLMATVRCGHTMPLSSATFCLPSCICALLRRLGTVLIACLLGTWRWSACIYVDTKEAARRRQRGIERGGGREERGAGLPGCWLCSSGAGTRVAPPHDHSQRSAGACMHAQPPLRHALLHAWPNVSPAKYS